MARSYLRGTALVGAFGLGLLAMSPAVAATENQAGATALYLAIAGNGQDSGNVTATYENGKETKTGETEPAFPQPAQDYITGGVLAQEASAQPGISTACAGLAGDGGSAVKIGETSCLAPSNLVTGSLTDFDLGDLFDTTTDGIVSQLPQEAQDQLGAILDPLGDGTDELKSALDPILSQLKTQFGDSGLIANLDMIEGRCTAGDGGPTGDSTFANAKVQLKTPDGRVITLLTLPVNPPKNTHLTTDLADVLDAILAGVDKQLTEGIDGALGDATALTKAIHDQVVSQIRENAQDNFAPLEENVLDVVLNEQENPTPDSIKVRALHAKVLPVAEDQLGASLVDLQIGTAACAPVARDAVVSPPQAQADTPQVATPATPTGVSSGVAGAPADGIDPSTWALLALGSLGVLGAGLVGARRLLG